MLEMALMTPNTELPYFILGRFTSYHFFLSVFFKVVVQKVCFKPSACFRSVDASSLRLAAIGPVAGVASRARKMFIRYALADLLWTLEQFLILRCLLPGSPYKANAVMPVCITNITCLMNASSIAGQYKRTSKNAIAVQ
jgi:hypothetical protein